MNRYCDFTDEDLIRLYLAGDSSAFSWLVNRHKDRLFTTIVLLVKDRYLAEDIFQETFIKIVNALKAGHYTEHHRFVAWAARIAHNCCINHFRKTNVLIPVVLGYKEEICEFVACTAQSEEQRLIDGEWKRELHVMLDMLPETQREALILRYYADLSYKEIAQVVNVGINTALGRVRYAIMNLRKIMEHAEEDAVFA
ncbi:sigma-70 family RNA polymerase sigma factor [Chitinophaga agrisoli]|uniref:Sigma-70 family RNA polymerase sigma factor n=1 Tax=Chitinophaga agrisoli TaxID=2607653 RepID=A0A5B2VMQ9_9BACT|nr:sigma-70 family RNA polymerase sigma factor [Chitinophaga agrisoli]KAA2239978.1 sigma-70 family RNA polymerase sigma factor [Chitinophaga agrisoli]